MFDVDSVKKNKMVKKWSTDLAFLTYTSSQSTYIRKYSFSGEAPSRFSCAILQSFLSHDLF